MITLCIILIVICILVIIASFIYMVHSNHVYLFNINVLDAFAGKLNDIDSNDLHFNTLIDEYDKYFKIFESINDKNNKKFYSFKNLNVTTIYGKDIANYLQPYIDNKYL